MSIYKKLFEAKKEIGKISKDSTNPFFKSKYFDINSLLEHVEPVLQKNGLLLLQPIDKGFVSTDIYDIEGGECISSNIQLPNIQDPQKLGSAITYYRRYTLQSLLGLQAEDDDGNVATKQVKEEVKPILDEKGFAFLITKGTKEQIKQALNGRRINKIHKVQLERLLKE